MRKLLLLLALLSIPVPVWAQGQSTVVRGVDFSTLATTDVGDSTNHAFRVTIQNGITFASPQAVTQSGTWNIGTLTTLTTITNPVAVTGTFFQATQPVSGTVTANAGTGTFAVSGPLTDTQLRATAVPVSGTVTANAGTGTFAVSGTVTTTPPANASTNVAQLAGTTTDTNSGVKSAGTLRVVLATDQPALTNKLLVTPDSVALPANQSMNENQINGVAVLMGNGTTGTGSQRVTIASDNTAFAVNNTQQGTAAQNVTQFGGTNVSTGTGTGGTGIPRVTVSNDSNVLVTQSTSPWVENVSQFGGSAVVTGVGPSGSGIPRVTDSRDDIVGSGALTVASVTGAACPAASVSAVTTSTSCIVAPVSGFAGVAGVFFAGTSTGTVLYQASSDGGTTWSTAVVETSTITQVAFTVFTNPNPETAFNFLLGSNTSHVRVFITSCSGACGTMTALIRSSTISSVFTVGALPAGQFGNVPSLFGQQTALLALTTTPAAKTAGTNVQAMGDPYGTPFVRSDNINRFRCNMDSSAATSTVITGCIGSIATTAAPGAGLAIYITDIDFYASTISTISNRNVIQTGTTGTCGTGTSIMWAGYNPAAFQGNEVRFITPLRATTNGEVCFLNAVSGQKLITISGYVAP